MTLIPLVCPWNALEYRIGGASTGVCGADDVAENREDAGFAGRRDELSGTSGTSVAGMC